MSSFEQEVIDRLSRLETKIDNGISARLQLVEDFIRSHPQTCPLINRKKEAVYISVIVGGIIGLIEIIKVVVGAIK